MGLAAFIGVAIWKRRLEENVTQALGNPNGMIEFLQKLQEMDDEA